jgi:hypothetical protein
VFHQGDVAKLEVLLEYGGIYLDYDVFVVNNMNPLRRYPATYGEKCLYKQILKGENSFEHGPFYMFQETFAERTLMMIFMHPCIPIRQYVARTMLAGVLDYLTRISEV